MAFQDFWRGGRERSDRHRDRDREQEMRSPEDPRDFGRPNYIGDEQGFSRRGWREGSDYYGNRPERYSNRGYGSARWQGDEFTGGEQYGGAEDDWRDRFSRSRGEVDESRRGTSFNDRWENAYEPGIRTYGDRSRFETRDEEDALQGPQFRGRGPRGYRRSDERIREDVCEHLTDDDRIDATDIDVTVKEGEVTLAGTVSTREQKRRAEDVIERLLGVKDVHNSLRIAAGGQASSTQGQQTSARPEQAAPGSRH